MTAETTAKNQSGGRSATPTPSTEARRASRKLLSGDGNWWWNGRRWIPAVTEDGLWQWDGSRWKSTSDIDGKRPEELAATLANLAENTYARAGVILAERAEDWEAEAEQRELVQQTQELSRRLRGVEEGLRSMNGGRSGILGRRSAGPADRQQLEEEQARLNDQYRALALQLARNAIQPSVKEADDVLAAAALLEESSALLTAALADVDEAERKRAEGVVAQQAEHTAAEEARVKALHDAGRAVRTAEGTHARAVGEARARLRATLRPGPGELKAGLGPLRLHAMLLETPAGPLAAAGLRALADTAAGLWLGHRDQLIDLLLVEAPETPAFLAALAERRDGLFLLLSGSTGTVLWACPAGQEKAARNFAALVAEHADEVAAARNECEAAALQADKELDGILRDRSAIEAAEADLDRIEKDPSLLGAIDAARERLERARADTPELIDARRRVSDLARRLVAPPEPLRAAAPAAEGR